MVKITSTNIVGSAGQTTWSQAQSTAISDNKQLLVVLQLVSEENETLVDLATVGPETLSEIEVKGRQIGDLASLQKLVDGVVAELAEGLQVSLLLGLVEGDKLLITGKGAIEACLSREGKMAKLGMGIEGVIKDGDSIVLSTSKFIEVVGIVKLKAIIAEDENPAEVLAPLVHTQSETSEVAAIVVSVSEEATVPAEGWLTKLLNRKPTIRLRDETPRKLNMWIGGGILLLLILMIGIGMVRRVRVMGEQELAELSSSVNTKIATALSQGELNPDQARFLLTQARGEVEAYMGTDAKDTYKERARQLMVQIENADERAFKKNDIKLDTVVELPILLGGLHSDQMKSDGKGNLIFLDIRESRIVAMNLGDRSRQTIESETTYTDMGVSESKIYGLESGGVTEMFWKKNEEKKVIEPDEFWKEPILIGLFAGNVYVLDKGQGEIWKYPTLGDTFGGRRRWFAVGIAPDLSNVVDMKVVGDIWLLTSSGKVERYSRGAPVAFSMEGFPTTLESKKLSDPESIWVSESLVYILERGAGRVVVFDMEGKYSEQYVNSEFAKASDLVVVDNKGYVLIDNTVKEFGL
jgi:hypothetical protein